MEQSIFMLPVHRVQRMLHLLLAIAIHEQFGPSHVALCIRCSVILVMNHTRLILSSFILLEELSQWKTVISDDIGKYRKVIGINVAGLHEVRISYEDYATN